MTISHGNITHAEHKGRGVDVIAHNHNGGLLLVLASIGNGNPGTLDWNGAALTKKLGTGYSGAVPSCDVWWLQGGDQGAHNLTVNNEGDDYLYTHICIISVIGASEDADPFGQTDTNAGTSADSSGTLASCDPTSRTYYVTGLNTAGTLKLQSGGGGQTELWDGLNVDNDCSAGYWEDGETAMTSTWSGACAWETATAELKMAAAAAGDQVMWIM